MGRCVFCCHLITGASRTSGDGPFGRCCCLLLNGSDLLKHGISIRKKKKKNRRCDAEKPLWWSLLGCWKQKRLKNRLC